jgi:hypothetical protein
MNPRALLLLLLAPLAASALEIATGKMLGPNYRQRSFYTRPDGKSKWALTYSGKNFRPEAQGRLMNIRAAQAIVHDEWLTEEPFDPERNTDRVIAALDSWKQHGILSVGVSLQGANAAYERTPNIKRTRPYSRGPGKGMSMSAFNPDGTLKDRWMKRLLKIAQALKDRGMILNLTYFYAWQDEVLTGPAQIDNAVIQATDWLIANNISNLIIEIANEYNAGAFDHNRYIESAMGHLIQLARSRYVEKNVPYRVPISASSNGNVRKGEQDMKVDDGIRDYGDLVLTHGNHMTPERKRVRVKELFNNPGVPGPIVINEDDNGRETTLAHLKLELDSCDAIWDSGGSWGYMPWVQFQIWPFRNYLPGPSAKVTDDMPVPERDAAYFKAVLEHIARKVFK